VAGQHTRPVGCQVGVNYGADWREQVGGYRPRRLRGINSRVGARKQGEMTSGRACMRAWNSFSHCAKKRQSRPPPPVNPPVLSIKPSACCGAEDEEEAQAGRQAGRLHGGKRATSTRVRGGAFLLLLTWKDERHHRQPPGAPRDVAAWHLWLMVVRAARLTLHAWGQSKAAVAILREGGRASPSASQGTARHSTTGWHRGHARHALHCTANRAAAAATCARERENPL
jgi:hypothetical protein